MCVKDFWEERKGEEGGTTPFVPRLYTTFIACTMKCAYAFLWIRFMTCCDELCIVHVHREVGSMFRGVFPIAPCGDSFLTSE